MKEKQVDVVLSVIIPCYNEKGNLIALYDALCKVLGGLDLSYELLFVDDGSSDGSLSLLRTLCEGNENTHYISFSRNFGHQHALLAGLHYASGKVCITMDADMEHPPALLPQLIRLWQEGYDVVNTNRSYSQSRSIWKRMASPIYYRIFALLTGKQCSFIGADFRLLDRRVVDVVLSSGRDSLFLRGLIGWVGFRQCTLPYTSGERFSGQTHYPFSRLLRLALEGLTSFSLRPLRISLFFSSLFALLAGLGLVHILYVSCGTQHLVSEWQILGVLICFLGAVMLLVLGVIGEYLGRCFMRLSDRPLYVVAETSLKRENEFH